MNWDSVSHYEVLQVTQTAPLSVIKASYKALIQQYHPDRYSPSGDAERFTKRLNEAYATLCDPDLRAAHDAFLAKRSYQTETPSSPNPRAHSEKPTSPTAKPVENAWPGRLVLFSMLFFSGSIGSGLLGGGVIPYLLGVAAGWILFWVGRRLWGDWNGLGKAVILTAWLGICLSGIVFTQIQSNDRHGLNSVATTAPNPVQESEQHPDFVMGVSADKDRTDQPYMEHPWSGNIFDQYDNVQAIEATARSIPQISEPRAWAAVIAWQGVFMGRGEREANVALYMAVDTVLEDIKANRGVCRPGDTIKIPASEASAAAPKDSEWVSIICDANR